MSHKGLDLICEVLHDMIELPIQLVVLGKGDRKYEEFFHWAAQQHSGRMAVRLDYNEDLSMAIYAGADLFLMPSKSEPCGLSQMIAMRYGTVPIVRETGGLKDTVQPYESWRDSGNGFTFTNYASGDMLYVIREAVYLYKDYPDVFGRLRQRAMQCDFSWARSAREYLGIYAGITGRHWPAAGSAETSAAGENAPEAVEAFAVKNVAPETAEAVHAEHAAPKDAPAAEEAVPETARRPAVKESAAKPKAVRRKAAAKPQTKKKGPAAKEPPAAE